MKFAILENLVRFWENLKNIFVEKEDGKGLSTNDFTDALKNDYDEAAEHSLVDHAPADAQKNIITGIEVNEEALTPDEKVVDITIPTKISDLEDIEGLDMSHPEVEVDDDTDDTDDPGYEGSFDVVDEIARDEYGHVINLNTKTITLPEEYEHPESTIEPDTYRSVTVDEDGHGTAGTNPTTRDGMGLTDVPTIVELADIIQTTVTESGKLKKTIVTVLPDPADADVNTIYFILRDTPDGANNIYDEWMLIDGEWEKIGDTMSSIENLILKSDMEVATEEDIDLLVMTDDEIVSEIAGIVMSFGFFGGDNTSETHITGDLLVLPTMGTQIEGFGYIHQEVFIDWQSDKPEVVDPTSGEVNRPSFTNGDEDVVLTCTVICGEASETTDFDLVVKHLDPTDEEAVQLTKDDLTWDSIKLLNSATDNILTDLSLPTVGLHGSDIAWASSNTTVINPTTGVVTRPDWVDGDANVTLTATISRDDDE